MVCDHKGNLGILFSYPFSRQLGFNIAFKKGLAICCCEDYGLSPQSLYRVLFRSAVPG